MAADSYFFETYTLFWHTLRFGAPDANGAGPRHLI